MVFVGKLNHHIGELHSIERCHFVFFGKLGMNSCIVGDKLDVVIFRRQLLERLINHIGKRVHAAEIVLLRHENDVEINRLAPFFRLKKFGHFFAEGVGE